MPGLEVPMGTEVGVPAGGEGTAAAVNDDRAVGDVLLEAAQAGDAAALRLLYDDLAPKVAAYLRAHRARDVDDLTNEVFLAVFSRLGSVTGGYLGLRTLTFSVAHARYVDVTRARVRRPDPTPYDPDGDPRISPSAEDVAASRQGTDRAVALLEQLPDAQRKVILLRVLGDLGISEVADILDTTQGAVKQLQRRGLLALRKLVAEQDVTL